MSMDNLNYSQPTEREDNPKWTRYAEAIGGGITLLLFLASFVGVPAFIIWRAVA